MAPVNQSHMIASASHPVNSVAAAGCLWYDGKSIYRTAIRVTNRSKRFDRTVAVDSFSFEIFEGELFGLGLR